MNALELAISQEPPASRAIAGEKRSGELKCLVEKLSNRSTFPPPPSMAVDDLHGDDSTCGLLCTAEQTKTYQAFVYYSYD